MKRTVLLLWLIVFSQSVFCQVNIDSLLGIWNDIEQPDTTRLQAIQVLAVKGYVFSKPDSAFYYAQLQYNFAESKNLKKYMALALNTQGLSYWFRGDYDSTLLFFTRSLTINEEIDEKKTIAALLNNIAVVHKEQGNYASAIKQHTRSLKIKEEINDEDGIVYSLNNIGVIHNEQGHPAEALKYLNQGVKLAEKAGIKNASLFVNIGLAHKKQENYASAITAYKRGLEVYEENQDQIGIGRTLGNIGHVYIALGDHAKALDYLTRSLKIRQDIGHQVGIASALNSLGSIYVEQGKYFKGIDHSKQALSIAQEVGSLLELKDATKTLYESYKEIGRSELALEMYELHIATNDSLESEENQREILRQEYKYAYEKQALADSITFVEAKKVQEVKLEQSRTQQLALIIGLGLMLVLALTIARANYTKKKVNQQLLSKNKFIEGQKQQIAENLEEVKVLNQTLDTQNNKLLELSHFKERMTGMIVHDLKNPLNAIINLTKEKDTQQSGKQMLNLVLNILDVQKFESAEFTLRQEVIALKNLVTEALEQVYFLIDRKSIKLVKSISAGLEVLADRELVVRVLVNLLTNAIKYSPNNSQIEVYTTVENKSEIKISIRDEGSGIPEQQLEVVFDEFVQIDPNQNTGVKSTGLGLTFCKLAVEANGGRIGVSSKLDKGSEFWFTLPLHADEAETALEERSSHHIDKSLLLSLNPSEKTYLSDFTTKLNEFSVYEYSDVMSVLEQIDSDRHENVRQWKEQVELALRACNETKYLRLLKLV